MKRLIRAKATGQTELQTGERVYAPLELQLGWMAERWGVEVLGQPPDFKMVGKISHALDIYKTHRKPIKDRTPSDWELIKRLMMELDSFTF